MFSAVCDLVLREDFSLDKLKAWIFVTPTLPPFVTSEKEVSICLSLELRFKVTRDTRERFDQTLLIPR